MAGRAGTVAACCGAPLPAGVVLEEVQDASRRQAGRPVLDVEGLAVLVIEEGQLRVVGSRGFPAETTVQFDDLPVATSRQGTRAVEMGVPSFHTSNAELVRTFPQRPVYREMAAFAFLPLTVSGGTYGWLVLGYGRPRLFPKEDRAELTALAGVIAQALERVRLYDANAQVARGLQD